MGSLTKVSLPQSARGIQVLSKGGLLVWTEHLGPEGAEALSLMRGFLAGRFGFTMHNINGLGPLAAQGWVVNRLVRLSLLGADVVVAESCHPELNPDPSPWWQDVLVPEINAKWPALGPIEGPDAAV